MSEFRSIIEAPRWAGFPKLLKDLAWKASLSLEIEVEKHIINETVRFKLEGDPETLERAVRGLNASITEYNSRG